MAMMAGRRADEEGAVKTPSFHRMITALVRKDL
jgi:hypothetical protein